MSGVLSVQIGVSVELAGSWSSYPLSPRVRGNPGLARVGEGWRGLIPACAGEPHRCSVRGWALKVGLSPRVRGNLACTPYPLDMWLSLCVPHFAVPPTARACVLDDDVPLVPCPLFDLPLMALASTHVSPYPFSFAFLRRRRLYSRRCLLDSAASFAMLQASEHVTAQLHRSRRSAGIGSLHIRHSMTTSVHLYRTPYTLHTAGDSRSTVEAGHVHRLEGGPRRAPV